MIDYFILILFIKSFSFFFNIKYFNIYKLMKFLNINFGIVLNILGTSKILNSRKTREEV